MKKSFNNIGEIIEHGAKLFDENDLCFYHGTDNAFDEAYLIVAHCLELDPISENINFSDKIDIFQTNNILSLYQERITKKLPVAYLTNKAYFGNREYYVDRRVMIPTSPFAEIIKDRFRPWLQHSPTMILDLCTGSGALGISCSYEFPNAKVHVSDKSSSALEVAKININKHSMSHAIKRIQSDLFENINDKYDIIISNPPYVDIDHYKLLADEFKQEPKEAFISEKEGIGITERILLNAKKHLSDNGLLFVEVGEYCDRLEKYFPEMPFTWVSLYNGGEGIFMLTKNDLKKIRS